MSTTPAGNTPRLIGWLDTPIPGKKVMVTTNPRRATTKGGKRGMTAEQRRDKRLSTRASRRRAARKVNQP